MKLISTLIFSFFCLWANCQTIDDIYVHLYTDSLKKGTFNYINIDGKLSSGKFMPLDTSQISLESDHGKFTGNDLWIPKDFSKEKVNIQVILRSNPSIFRNFSVYIKTLPDPELMTEPEVLEKMKKSAKKKKNS